MDEPEFVERLDSMPGLDYEETDFYHHRQNVPFPPEQNRPIREKIEQSLKAIKAKSPKTKN